MVSEVCVHQIGADVAENQAGEWPISLGTPAVRVTEKVKGHD